MEGTCTCGDVFDEHGGDPEYPGSTACRIEDCDCVAFEQADDDETDSDPGDENVPEED